jgi:N-acetylglucosamine-6-phosphate deacetylase
MSNVEINGMLLRGARVVLPGRVEGKSLLVEDGLITRICDEGTSAGENVRTLNLDGLTLFPGFIDLHIHGSVGVDTMEAGAEGLHRVASFLARNGITAWLPTLVPAPSEDYRHAARAIEQLMREQENRSAAARALGLHYEGPFVNVAQCGALRQEYFRTFKNRADVDALPVFENVGAAKMITVAPETEGGVEVSKELRARGFVVAIGQQFGQVS